LKIRSFPPARRPSKEESQRPAGQQADRKDHGEEGDYSAAQSLENSRRHEVVGGDEQQLIGQHADSMTGGTSTSGGRIAVSAMPLAPAQHQRQKSAFVAPNGCDSLSWLHRDGWKWLHQDEVSASL
jgi:hypothetical protein